MVVDESALLDGIEAVETISVSLRAYEDFLHYVELDHEENDHADREDEGREGSKGGNGFVDELIEVGCVIVKLMSWTGKAMFILACHVVRYSFFLRPKSTRARYVEKVGKFLVLPRAPR